MIFSGLIGRIFPMNDSLGKIFYNHLQWVYPCVIEGDADAFPYFPQEKEGVANIDNSPEAVPDGPFAPFPQREEPELGYLLNIPARFRDAEECAALLEKLRDEAFLGNSRQSRRLAKDRVAVVLGVNKRRSLDESANQFDGLDEMRTVGNLHYKIVPFFWVPQWSCSLERSRKLYSKEDAFRLFKVLRPKKAANWLKEVEGGEVVSKQLNFQRMRQTIKDSTFTREFHRAMGASGLRVYYGIVDADFETLRLEDEGILSVADRRIAEYEENNGCIPSVFSPGYFAGPDETPLTRLAIKLDMAVRAAMAESIPMAPYYPEPATFVYTGEDVRDFRKLTFIGAGRTLESRRFLQSGIEAKILEKETFLFTADPCLATTIPDRLKPTNHQNVHDLTFENIGKKSVLQSLRGIGQTHIFPKIWGDEMYKALPVTASRVTELTGPMMRLFSLFDPINLTYQVPANLNTRYHHKYFEIVLGFFDDYVDYMTGKLELKTLVSRLKVAPGEKRDYRAFFQSRNTSLDEEIGNIKQFVKKQEWIDLIQQAAIDSGRAIHTVFMDSLE